MNVRLFGGLEVAGRDGADIRFAARKSALVLAILALSGPKGLTRDRLCGLLWEDRGEPQARASLRQALVELRRHIALHGAPHFEITGDADLISLEGPVNDIDVWRFDPLVERGDLKSLEVAATLYDGELLGAVEMPEAASDWVAPIRQGY